MKGNGNNDIIQSGAVSGARDPNSTEADEHAERYYALVRTMKTDVTKIARTTGRSKEEIQAIKNYIFIDEHDLGGEELQDLIQIL
ncbi:hypothetical protein C7122_03940 [Lachnospiraceae bacterium oral taxon 096]|nr:hypothetical protein C7122_03940 [Lachnospiraceae bacterium oral taxon 096]